MEPSCLSGEECASQAGRLSEGESGCSTKTLQGRRIAAMQPYFIPYMGYFQLLTAVDQFVVLDDVNFIKRGWINRNRILLNGAAHWITLPLVRASQNRRIEEIQIVEDRFWREKMSAQVRGAYRKAPHGKAAVELFECLMELGGTDLSSFLVASLKIVRDFLQIETSIILASKSHPRGEFRGQARILDLCRREATDAYVNPVGGELLYDAEEFRKNGVKLAFLRPELSSYNQGGGEEKFVSDLSVLDMIAWTGLEGCLERLRQFQLDVRN